MPSQDTSTLITLARRGLLASAFATADVLSRRSMLRELYSITWPIVFTKITRPAERKRGHQRCAKAFANLMPECADRFHDDVAAVVQEIVRRADRPIAGLEAWIASMARSATVDAHRRRRGDLGALQRPRLPQWLARELGGDEWLGRLAVHVLEWVGVPATAGTGLWPLDSWTDLRAEVRCDWQRSSPELVAEEVEVVLAAMRTRPAWYADHVERPLGCKESPTATSPGPLPALVLVDEHETTDSRLTAAARLAMHQIVSRIGRGEVPEIVVHDVVRTLFCGGDALGGHLAEWLDAELLDEAGLRRVIGAVLLVVDDDSAVRTG
ncbi:hypothetical protein [Lentzea sp. CC55]|uniref:hypothetical protein n=1 Tax=Lentzea sp. CC55 TaxID=2884909 RepID=UPI001F15ACB9|nr:hypothetical protein [Lentzea sp. CC55]MCG8925146.1 hypothetical protein [Lentzea sp. CC55]